MRVLITLVWELHPSGSQTGICLEKCSVDAPITAKRRACGLCRALQPMRGLKHASYLFAIAGLVPVSSMSLAYHPDFHRAAFSHPTTGIFIPASSREALQKEEVQDEKPKSTSITGTTYHNILCFVKQNNSTLSFFK